jgi:hypothetical protein
MMQHSLFDGPRSDYMKERGMKIAESNAETALGLARGIAKELARHKPVVNADDVGRVLKQRHGIETLGPAAGSLFKSSEWVFTGQWVKSARISNHSRMIRNWRLK